MRDAFLEKERALKLRDALGISAGETVAFAGAGGKSGAILALSEEISRAGESVLVAPTTKMFLQEARHVGPVATSGDLEELARGISKLLEESRAVVAGEEFLTKERLGGVDPSWVTHLSSLVDVTLVEADGSRRRPIKGTADHEPVLPEETDLVVAVGNVSALGKPVNEEFVHRPKVFSELTGVEPEQSITADAFATALVKGSLGELPSETRRAVLLTGVEPGKSMAAAAGISRQVWSLGVQKVVLGSLARGRPPQIWLP